MTDFIIYPAIDMKGGKVVRLYQGDMERATHYGDDPLAMAQKFYQAGASHLHLVNLDGAVSDDGTGDLAMTNNQAIDKIIAWRNIKAKDLSLQLGGGIRNGAMVQSWLGKGINRVVLGTWALEQRDEVIKFCQVNKGIEKKLALAVDCKGGIVMVRGWVKQSPAYTPEDLIGVYLNRGIQFSAVIHTDIDKDGTGMGANQKASARLAKYCEGKIPVIVSGGVGSAEDIVNLRKQNKFAGVIVGRAIYDNKIDIQKIFQKNDL